MMIFAGSNLARALPGHLRSQAGVVEPTGLLVEAHPAHGDGVAEAELPQVAQTQDITQHSFHACNCCRQAHLEPHRCSPHAETVLTTPTRQEVLIDFGARRRWMTLRNKSVPNTARLVQQQRTVCSAFQHLDLVHEPLQQLEPQASHFASTWCAESPTATRTAGVATARWRVTATGRAIFPLLPTPLHSHSQCWRVS